MARMLKMKWKLGMAAFAGLTAISCGQQQTGSETKNVFGEDNRVEMNSTARPWSGIGRLRMGSSGFCTGALVWHNLVLTNAHCVYKDGELRSNIRWVAGDGTSNETTYGVSRVWAGTRNPQSNRKEDWAILKLNRTAQGRYYFGYKSQRNLDPFGRGLTMVGYSGDFYRETGKAGIHHRCHIRGDEFGYYLHDCDTRGGSSGGPIYAKVGGERFIVGINAAHRQCGRNNDEVCPDGIRYSNGDANIAVKTDRFTSKLSELRRANPRN